MNKYLKILALTGGTLGAIVPTALRIDNNACSNDLMDMYESVSSLEPIKPRLSRINYQLNINPTSGDDAVTFVTHDENGEEKPLEQGETITYLNSTLEEVSTEYEHLRQTLTKAIKETMDYLDKAKENDTLTNEQKIYIKEHTNSIKFLAETLEDLSEDVLCCIDGIECDDCEDTEQVAAKYLKVIDNLEDRINALQNSLNSLQIINGISNPYFNTPYNYPPNTIIYGLKYGKRPKLDDNNLGIGNKDNQTPDTAEDDLGKEDKEDIDTEETAPDKTNESTDTEKSASNEIDNTETEGAANGEDEDYQTFKLQSNIDTYAPTKRNIDTFFNTALLDQDEYGYGNMYGYGYGMPYGGMMYNGYGNPYGNMAYGEYNSNMINRKVLEDNQNNYMPSNTRANVEPEETPKTDTRKINKVKRASNIDTYSGTTIKSNINSMGESKISRFIKDKFNDIRNKVRNKKQQTEQHMHDTKDIKENPNRTPTERMDDTYKYARTPTEEQPRTEHTASDNFTLDHQSPNQIGSHNNTNTPTEGNNNQQNDLSNQNSSSTIDTSNPNREYSPNSEQHIQTLPDFSGERAVADEPKVEKVDDIKAK